MILLPKELTVIVAISHHLKQCWYTDAYMRHQGGDELKYICVNCFVNWVSYKNIHHTEFTTHKII